MKELLQNIELFAGLDHRLLAQIAEVGIRRRYRRGDVIVEQGEIGLGMYVMIRGTVQVLLMPAAAAAAAAAGGPREVARLGPEQVFAEMALLDEQPRSARVVAAEDVECLLLTRDSFAAVMRRSPEIPIRVARALAGRLRAANDRWAASGISVSEPDRDLARPAVLSAGEAGPRPAINPMTPTGVKANIQGAFLSMFQHFYTMKAMTRFSVAVLGCPVEGRADNVLEELRAGEVKALILPAQEPVELQVAAQSAGFFTLHFFTPTRATPRVWGPEPIAAGEDVRLLVSGAGNAELRRGQSAGMRESGLRGR